MKVILQNGSVHEYTFDTEVGKEAFRHTTSHILAQAVKRLYPTAKCAIGPAIKDGFYYDFEFDFDFTDDNLAEIEKEMKKIIKENLKLTHFTMEREEALKIMKEKNEDYKVQLINDLPEDAVLSFFRQGDYLELCAGPHVTYTSAIKAFKLLNVAGAYWRGDEHNKMLTRIYGTSFPNKEMLDEYLNMLEEAKKRDHRKLGKELKLFTLMDEGPGFPFFLPKGMILKNILIDYWRKIHSREGYVEISTPIILNRKLWETSGHWDHYRENMYTTVIDDVDYAIKPMNCPGSILVYKMEPRSYRDLPMRLAELGLVHRHEKSGQLHGLFRVRCFTQDDGHIQLAPEQVPYEIKNIVRLIDEVYSKFGFKYHMELSTRPEDSMGTDEEWELATNSLKNAMDELGKPYVINEGDGAFYGPKIDLSMKDCLGREWQMGTIQLDFQLPHNFGLTYQTREGGTEMPVVIHRAIYGSLERFIGIIIEHFKGAFPFWMSPYQVAVVPIRTSHNAYAQEVVNALDEAGIRVEADFADKNMNEKIKAYKTMKDPYILVVGDQEVENRTVAITIRGQKQQLHDVPLDQFVAICKRMNAAHTRELDIQF